VKFMILSFEVSAAVGLKAESLRDLVRQKQYDAFFDGILGYVLDEILKPENCKTRKKRKDVDNA
jgi:hypothetical protein